MERTIELTSEKAAHENVNEQSKLVTQAMDPYVSDNLLSTLTIVIDVWISLILSTFGVFSNVLTLIVFTRLGFKDTVNITMTAMTAWDLIRVLCGALHRTYGPISLFSEAMGKSWQNLTVPNLVYLNIIAGCASYVIGGYVALERCLCVMSPFKVKSIITPKVTICVCLAISIIVFIPLSPIFLVFQTTWVYSPQYGQLMGIYQYSDFFRVHCETYLAINRCLNFMYPMVSLAVMVVSTIIISFHLRSSSKFRQNLSSVKNQQSVQSEMLAKDKQVVKMLLVVIALYMVSLIPRVVNYAAMLAVEEYFTLKLYNNLLWVILYVLFFLDFVNSSGNLFIFYSMSSKFRQCARETFFWQSLPNSKQKTRDNPCLNR